MITSTIDTIKIHNLRPERVLGIALSIFILIIIIAPIDINNSLDFATGLYLTLSIFFFWLGTKIVRTKRIKPYSISVNSQNLKRLYRVTFVLGMLGVLFKLIDLIVYRNLSYDATILENFENVNELSGSIFSVISAALIFFAYIPFTIDSIFNIHTKLTKIISFILIMSTGMTTILLGSRNSIMIPLLFIAIILYVTKVKKISFKWVVLIIISLLISINIISTIFIKRLDEMNVSIYTASQSVTGGYSDKVPATDNYIRLMEENDDSILHSYLFGYVHICQYLSHAVFEFPAVKDYIDEKGDYYYGSATFGAITKVFQRLSNSSSKITEDILDHNYRPGIWSTFFFLWYLDFGWAGVVLMMIMGYISKKIWSKVCYHSQIALLPLLVYSVIILLFILQNNLIGGMGLYAIFSFSLLPIISRNCGVKFYRSE